jgi:hypothetical protein
MTITVLPFNQHFNEKCLIFNIGVITAHYKYTCILAATTLTIAANGQTTIVTA